MNRISRAGAVLLAALAASAAAHAAPPHLTRLATVNGTVSPAVATARTPDGTLHLVFQTYTGRTLSGLGAVSISPSGKPSAAVQALAGWQAGQPGLVALSNGQLAAVFGAISAGGDSSVWEILSSDGGATWSAPADVKGGGPNESLAYGADATAVLAPAGPVLSLPQAGNIVVQSGLGAGSPSVVVTNATDGSASDAELGVDASTGAVVAGWQSIARDPILDYLQAVTPSVGALQVVPGKPRNALQVAGRDTGSGVFAAYTPDDRHVRLLRYGGGSVAVGSLPTTSPKALGVATGLDGRIWVMWGDDSGGGFAVTRSNKAVTRFEPIQHLNHQSASLYRVFGDGRLGPLDLLVDELPDVKGQVVPPVGLYAARVLPVLSATVAVVPVKNKQGVVIAHKLVFEVTDAGDAVAGATVKAGTQTAKTNALGKATIVVAGSPGAFTVTSPGYSTLSQAIHD